MLVTLAHAAPALSARLTTIDALAGQLLHSELLFIRARLLPPREVILHERLTGRLVVARERDVPTLLDATKHARQQTTELTRTARRVGCHPDRNTSHRPSTGSRRMDALNGRGQ